MPFSFLTSLKLVIPIFPLFTLFLVHPVHVRRRPGVHKYLWWKKYITTLQLVLLVLILQASELSQPSPSAMFPWTGLQLFILFMLHAAGCMSMGNWTKQNKTKLRIYITYPICAYNVQIIQFTISTSNRPCVQRIILKKHQQ